MKTAKKILLIIVGIIIISAISSGLSLGMSLFFGLSFWKSFAFFSTLQVIVPELWRTYYVDKNVVESARIYAQKPYKKYMLALDCTHCGYTSQVEVDLSNETEYNCPHCKKDNGVHVQFMTTSITGTTYQEPNLNIL